jgi:glycerol-3-phosphate dehydrogenase subunit B
MEGRAERTFDTVVVGGGLAGAMAAMTAAANGCKVGVLCPSGGMTSLSSGAINIAPDPEGHHPGYTAGIGPSLTVEQTLNLLLEQLPGHPYNCAKSKTPFEALRQAVALLQKFCPELRVPNLTAKSKNLWLPDALGMVHVAGLGFFPQSRADLRALSEGQVAVIGFADIDSFSAKYVCEGLRKILGRHGDVEFIDVVLEKIFRRGDDPYCSAIRLAERCDLREDISFRIADELTLKIKGACSLYLFPPFLGYRRFQEIHDQLTEYLKVPTAETVSLHPSVPGLRITEALEQGLKRSGAEWINGVLTGVDLDERGISILYTDHPERLKVNKVVLATGKFAAGGIETHDALLERSFGCTLFVDQRQKPNLSAEGMLQAAMLKNFQQHAFARFVSERQPGMCIGLRVDEFMRPVNNEDAPEYVNLFAAGSILAGYDYVFDGCGLGTALVTGYLAGLAQSMALD